MAQALRPMPSTARELMCALADVSSNSLEDRAAVLVPEQTMAQFNLRPADPGHPSCATDTLDGRTAQYPPTYRSWTCRSSGSPGTTRAGTPTSAGRR